MLVQFLDHLLQRRCLTLFAEADPVLVDLDPLAHLYVREFELLLLGLPRVAFER